MTLDQGEGGADLARVESMILRQLDGRLKPELRFAGRAGDVDVSSRLLAREEKEAKTAFTEYRRTHGCTL
jgi:hypothetical protein